MRRIFPKTSEFLLVKKVASGLWGLPMSISRGDSHRPLGVGGEWHPRDGMSHLWGNTLIGAASRRPPLQIAWQGETQNEGSACHKAVGQAWNDLESRWRI